MGKHNSLHVTTQTALALQDHDTFGALLSPRVGIVPTQGQAEVVGLRAHAAATTGNWVVVDNAECMTSTRFSRTKSGGSEVHGRGGEGDCYFWFRWQDVGVDGGKRGRLIDRDEKYFDL